MEDREWIYPLVGIAIGGGLAYAFCDNHFGDGEFGGFVGMVIGFFVGIFLSGRRR